MIHQHLNKSNHDLKLLFKLIYIIFLISSVDLLFAFGIFFSLPDTRTLRVGVQLERRASDGHLFSFVAGPRHPRYIRLRNIPPTLIHAVLTLEDDRFYAHCGFDYKEIKNAVEDSVESNTRLRGASTLSQQLVKNLYLTNERSLTRKILEALITIKLELTLSKKTILELYLNTIDWGKNLLGISAATKFYFRKLPQDLSLKEAIFLASIIPNPARFGPTLHDIPPHSFVRRQIMKALESLYKKHLISLEQYEDVFWTTLHP